MPTVARLDREHKVSRPSKGVGITRTGDGYVKGTLATPAGARLPGEIDGVPVIVEVVGRIVKQ